MSSRPNTTVINETQTPGEQQQQQQLPQLGSEPSGLVKAAFDKWKLLYQRNSRKVHDLGNGLVLKEMDVHKSSSIEYSNLVMLNGRFKAPKAVSTWIENDKRYILMEKKDGVALSSKFDDMTDDDLCKVKTQLKDIVSEMYHFISDKYKGFDFIISPNSGEFGPFFNSDDLYDYRMQYLSEELMDHLDFPSIKDGSKPIFCHNDLGPYNILVDEEYNITAIVDWETSGFYPDHWDLFKTTMQPDFPDKWKIIMLELFIERCGDRSLMIKKLALEYEVYLSHIYNRHGHVKAKEMLVNKSYQLFKDKYIDTLNSKYS